MIVKHFSDKFIYTLISYSDTFYYNNEYKYTMILFTLIAAFALVTATFATLVNPVYAAQSQHGLSKAKENTCDRGHEQACGHICGFIRCVSLEVKNGVDFFHPELNI